MEWSSHWKTNQVISVDTHTDVPNPRHHTTRFHRGHLHAALLEHVPRKIIHLGKRVKIAQATPDGVSLHFEDGSSAHGHILIGADGIRSVSCNWSDSVRTLLISSKDSETIFQSRVPTEIQRKDFYESNFRRIFG